MDVPEVRRIGEHRIEARRRQLNIRRTGAADRDVAGAAIGPLFADPFAFDWHLHLAPADMLHFEGSIAVLLGPRVFLDDVRPSSRSNIRAGIVHNADQVGLALNEADGKTVDGENVQGLERHGVVTTQHVLIAQQIGEVRRQGVLDARVSHGRDLPAAHFEAEQLPGVEEFPIPLIAPTMEPVAFVACGNLLLRNELRRERPGAFFCLRCARQVLFVRLLEKPALMLGTSSRIGVLDRKESMAQRAVAFAGIFRLLAACLADTTAALRRPLNDQLFPAT